MMNRTTMRALALGVAIPVLAAARSPAQDPAGDAAPPGDPSRAGAARCEIEALTARIAELEKAASAGRAAASAMASPQASPTPPQTGTGVVSTASARDAGIKASAGAGDAAAVKVLLDLFQRRKAPALTKELGRLLERGEAAHATLYDFLSELDRGESREALLLNYDYHFSFSLVHLAMLHEEELAKLAHYFLAASKNTPRSTLRRTLFELLPEFLYFHRGRYPDLERDIEDEILRRLKDRKGNLQMYYSAMVSLGYKPPVEVFDPLLAAAASHAETLPPLLHLEARNDPAAVEILSRNIASNPPGMEWKAAILLDTLARMSSPDASWALMRFVGAADERLSSAAVQAFFSVPRDKTSLPMLLELLNRNVDIQQKRAAILRLRQANPGILEALKAEIDKVRSEEVRDLVRSGGLKDLQQPAGPR